MTQDTQLIEAPAHEKIKIAVLGSDDRAITLVRLFCELDDVEVVAVIDHHNSSCVATIASEENVKTLGNCKELEALDVDVIIEATRDEITGQCLSMTPKHIEVISEQSAALISRLLEAGKRGRENEKLLNELNEAYEKLSRREQEIESSRAALERTYSELERQLAEKFFMHEFFKTITSSNSSVDEVANLIADGANGILGVEFSCVYYSLANEKRLQLSGSQGRLQQDFKESIPFGAGLVGQCAEHLSLINMQGPADDKPLESFMTDGQALETQVAVPLMTQDHLLGVLAVGSTTDRRFAESELLRAESIGHMASLALQNAIFNSELERLAVTDRLTGLYNHGYFQRQLEKEIGLAQRNKFQISLLMMDIDYFKQFNDTFGHPKGDRVLKIFSDILTDLSRKEDTVARYGGEEFVVIVPATDKESAAIFAERIRAAIETKGFEGNSDNPRVTKTVSIGIATFPEDARTPPELIEKADRALYRAKHSGRNCVITA